MRGYVNGGGRGRRPVDGFRVWELGRDLEKPGGGGEQKYTGKLNRQSETAPRHPDPWDEGDGEMQT